MKRISLPVSVIAGTMLLAALHPTPGPAQDAGRSGTAPPPSGQAASRLGGGPAPRASAAPDITIAELMRRPAAYAGRQVTVTSEVEEVFTPWSVKLDEDRPLAGGSDHDVLVISALPLVESGFDPSWLNRKVRATGTVRVLQAPDFLREYGRGMNEELVRRFEGKPALIATSLAVVDGPPSRPQSSSAANGTSGASGSAGSAAAGGAETAAITACSPSDTYCPPAGPVWSVGATPSSGAGSGGTGR